MNKLISYSIFWGIVTLFSFFVIWGLIKGIKHMFDAPGNSILTASLIVGFIICWGVSFSFDPFNTVCGCAAGLAVGASGLLFYSLSFEKFFYAADNIVLFIGVTFIAFLLWRNKVPEFAKENKLPLSKTSRTLVIEYIVIIIILPIITQFTQLF